MLSHIIRFYGDALQGFMGSYLERSVHLFLEQQQQLRQDVDGLPGQTPWTMLNQLTERNLDLWKEYQQNLAGGVGHNAETVRVRNGAKSRAS